MAKGTVSKSPVVPAPSKQPEVRKSVTAPVQLPAGPYLESSHLEYLQRTAGNQAVSSLIGLQRAVAAPPKVAAPAKPSSVRAILGQKYPHLLSVLSEAQIAQLQRCMDAEFHIQQLRATPTGTFGTSEAAEMSQRLQEQEYHWGDVWHRNHVVVVPTAKLLSDDVLTGQVKERLAPGSKANSESQLDAAYRDMLYTQLIEYPVRIERKDGQFGTDFKVDLVWGPHDWDMDHNGGLIRWHDLMQIQKFSMPYVRQGHARSGRVSPLTRRHGCASDIQAVHGSQPGHRPRIPLRDRIPYQRESVGADRLCHVDTSRVGVRQCGHVVGESQPAVTRPSGSGRPSRSLRPRRPIRTRRTLWTGSPRWTLRTRGTGGSRVALETLRTRGTGGYAVDYNRQMVTLHFVRAPVPPNGTEIEPHPGQSPLLHAGADEADPLGGSPPD